MKVDLRTLRPNPTRDFTIDPLDEEIVERLKQSITDYNWWGGVVCRQTAEGTLQIAAGHHRVRAALDAGVTEAEVFVADDMDDATMIRIYATENATQRGSSSTSMAGVVGAAIKFVAKSILTGDGPQLLTNFDIPTLQRRLLSEDGTGERVIAAFLDGIPGINARVIQQQLINLKTSGDYARLIAEVEQEIADERRRIAEMAEVAQTSTIADYEKAYEMAQIAKGVAAKRERTFDFEGVAKILRNDYQVTTFRDVVTAPNMRAYIPVSEQATLAKQLVEYAAHSPKPQEVTSTFIRENVVNIIVNLKYADRSVRKKEEEMMLRTDRLQRAHHLQAEFCRYARAMAGAARRLEALHEIWPEDERFPFSVKLSETVQTIKKAVDTLDTQCNTTRGRQHQSQPPRTHKEVLHDTV